MPLRQVSAETSHSAGILSAVSTALSVTYVKPSEAVLSDLGLPKISSYLSLNLSGTVMLVRFTQFLNAPSPISVTLSGITTLLRLSQSAKAVPQILVTPSLMITLSSFIQLKKAPLPISQLSPLITSSPVRAEYANACSPISLMLSGISMLFNDSSP